MSGRQSQSAGSPWYKNPLVWIAAVAALALIGHFGPPSDSSASVAPTPEITVQPTPVTVENDTQQPLSGFCTGDNNIILIGDAAMLPSVYDAQSEPSPSDAECVEEDQAHRERLRRWHNGDFGFDLVRN